jgi:hypothetical protein
MPEDREISLQHLSGKELRISKRHGGTVEIRL